MKTILLDTDAAIEIIRGNPAPLDREPQAHWVLSTISEFEIKSGLRGKQGSKIEKRAIDFLNTIDILGFDSKAATEAAQIRNQLEQNGQPIGAYDTLLAGHAKSLQIALLTGNVREFNRIEGLNILTWR